MENGYYWARKVTPQEWEVVEVDGDNVWVIGECDCYEEDDFEFGDEIVCYEGLND